jgi:plastocyanin
MKYFFTFLMVLALMGGGCVSSDSTETKNDHYTSDAIITIEQQDGNEMELNVGQENENHVDVTDVTIGEANRVSINMESTNFSFSPNTINAETGSRIAITFTKNSGVHTFVIDEINLRFKINENERVIFNAPSKPGSYAFYCDIDDHRALGMEGVLIVE